MTTRRETYYGACISMFCWAVTDDWITCVVAMILANVLLVMIRHDIERGRNDNRL